MDHILIREWFRSAYKMLRDISHLQYLPQIIILIPALIYHHVLRLKTLVHPHVPPPRFSGY